MVVVRARRLLIQNWRGLLILSCRGGVVFVSVVLGLRGRMGLMGLGGMMIPRGMMTGRVVPPGSIVRLLLILVLRLRLRLRALGVLSLI
jgi:hypothetical protein